MIHADQFARLSLNQITTDRLSLQEAAACCVRANVPWIAPWRHKVADIGSKDAARIVRDAGLHVSSLCRGGMFPAGSKSDAEARIKENLQAIDEAAELGTDVLVLVCGPAADKDIAGARKMVMDGIAAVAPYAQSCGVRLAIEPLHPMYAAERSVIVTLGQANQMVAELGLDNVGVIVDVFHVWWDPLLYQEIHRAKGNILGFHVSDWIVPTPDMLLGRGMMGDGVIEIQKIYHAVQQTGYTGPIEVEIFNREIWNRPPDELMAEMKARFVANVIGRVKEVHP